MCSVRSMWKMCNIFRAIIWATKTWLRGNDNGRSTASLSEKVKQGKVSTVDLAILPDSFFDFDVVRMSLGS